MPRFYEEAARLLFVMMAHGIAFSPGTDHMRLLQRVAVMLDQCIKDRPTHADAASAMLNALSTQGLIAISLRDRARMIALIGTMVGNIMTMHRR